MGKEAIVACIFVLAFLAAPFSLAQAEQLQDKIPDIKTVTSQVSALVSSFPPTQYVADGAEICLLIRTEEQSFLSFDILKEDGTLYIDPSPTSIYCDNTPANEGPEDLVIQYTSYEAFLRHVNDPSCNKFKTGGAGREFYYLPSQFVEPGGKPVCDSTFQKRYCPAVRACATNAEMRAGGLGCCIESPILGNTAVLAMLLFALLASFLITLFIIIRKNNAERAQEVMVLHAEKMRQLREFIENEIKQGYSTREIREHLLRSGWSNDAIEAAMESYEKPFW